MLELQERGRVEYGPWCVGHPPAPPQCTTPSLGKVRPSSRAGAGEEREERERDAEGRNAAAPIEQCKKTVWRAPPSCHPLEAARFWPPHTACICSLTPRQLQPRALVQRPAPAISVATLRAWLSPQPQFDPSSRSGSRRKRRPSGWGIATGTEERCRAARRVPSPPRFHRSPPPPARGREVPK